MSTKSDLDDSVAHGLAAARIVGRRNSYKADNPAEAAAVLAYLDGGNKPNNVATEMGKHLVYLEDARRGLVVVVPPPIDPPPVDPPVATSLFGPGQFADKAPATWSDASLWEPADLTNTLAAGVTSSNATVSGYGSAVVYATANDPIVSLTKTNSWGPAPSGLQFRCPTAAKPASGTDGHLTVIQPDGSMVEMWKAVRVGSNWSCGAAGKMAAGGYTYSIAACRGSSFTLPAGAMDPDAYSAGGFNYALSVVLSSSVTRKAYVEPSNDTDGVQVGSQFIAEGARICLDPSYDLTGFTGLERAVAVALQKYGAIVVDKTSGTEFSLIAVSPETWTAFGKPDKWAALGITGYPQFPKIVKAIQAKRVKVAKYKNLRLKG